MLTRAAARAARAEVHRPKSAGLASSAGTGVGAGADQSQLSVKHDTDQCELFIEIPNCDEKAYLQYEHAADGILDLQHTVVPEAFRGRGVAKILAKAAFDYVIEQDKKMKLTCWYLQKYIKNNPSPEYTIRVVE